MLRIHLLAILFLASMVLHAEDTDKPGASAEYKVIKKTVLGGDGSWDCLNVDSAERKLYIARANRIMVVDLDADKLVTEWTGINGAHGVALVPDLHRAYATSGKDDSVRVFDLQTNKEVEKIATGKKPDLIIYDPHSKKVFAFNNGGTTTTVIDPATNKTVGEIELGGNPEFAVTDANGKIFVNIEDKSEIVAVDSDKLMVANHWPLAPGTEPTGLSIDAAHHRLFSGCRGTNTLEVMDSESGKILASLPIGKGQDGTAFDPETQNAFSSNGEGTLTIIHEDSPESFRVVQTLATQAGARTMTIDSKTHQAILVSAEQNKETRKVTPDTFVLIKAGK